MKQTKAAILSGCTKGITSSKVIANNTIKVKYEDGSEAIRLHQTDVITFLPSGKIVLNSGGWQTVTTKERINRYSPARLSQNKGVWYVNGSMFYDGIEINEAGEVTSKVKAANLPAIDKMKKRISKFVALITKDNLPIPNSGDCWLCSLHTEDGKTIGGDDNGHLLEHLKEGYLHGSLLVNAMREYGYQDNQIQFHFSGRYIDTFKRTLRRYLQKRLIKGIAVK